MIIGHQKIWEFLTKSAQMDKLSHAYLFSGQEKLGKRTLAIEFTKWLFKENNLKKRYLDFIFVGPIRKEIQIAQIRDLIWRLSLKPSASSRKVAIIDQAHFLNQEAQSLLLKTLEEPKGNNILILITEHPELLFPTILSRLQKVNFYPPKKDEIKAYLRNQNLQEKKMELILELSQGKPGFAVDFVNHSQKLEELEQTIKKLMEIIGSPLALRFQYVKDLVGKPDELKKILEVWLVFFRKEMMRRLLDIKEKSFLGGKYPLSKLRNILWHIQNVIFLISKTNVNLRLTLEKLVMDF